MTDDHGMDARGTQRYVGRIRRRRRLVRSLLVVLAAVAAVVTATAVLPPLGAYTPAKAERDLQRDVLDPLADAGLGDGYAVTLRTATAVECGVRPDARRDWVLRVELTLDATVDPTAVAGAIIGAERFDTHGAEDVWFVGDRPRGDREPWRGTLAQHRRGAPHVLGLQAGPVRARPHQLGHWTIREGC